VLVCASQASCCLPPSVPPSSFLPLSVPLYLPDQLFLPREKGFVDRFRHPEIELAGSDELSLGQLGRKYHSWTTT